MPTFGGAQGELLYHYTGAEAALDHILPENRLRLSPYCLMNDPQEAKQWPFLYGDELDSRITAAISASIDAIRRLTYIASFSIDAGLLPTQRGYGRARMWHHYAHANAGVCLCFDRKRLLRSARAHLPYTTRSDPVQYAIGGFATSPARQLPTGHFHQVLRRFDRLSRDEQSQALNELIDSLPKYHGGVPPSEGGIVLQVVAVLTIKFLITHMDDLFLRKEQDWQTEQEYRITHTDLAGPKWVFLPIDDALQAVILGPEFPKWSVPAAKLACGERGVEVRKLDCRGAGPPLR
jgi:hypothetical protein